MKNTPIQQGDSTLNLHRKETNKKSDHNSLSLTKNNSSLKQ